MAAGSKFLIWEVHRDGFAAETDTTAMEIMTGKEFAEICTAWEV